jgi:hypothetical protein
MCGNSYSPSDAFAIGQLRGRIVRRQADGQIITELTAGGKDTRDAVITEFFCRLATEFYGEWQQCKARRPVRAGAGPSPCNRWFLPERKRQPFCSKTCEERLSKATRRQEAKAQPSRKAP